MELPQYPQYRLSIMRTMAIDSLGLNPSFLT